ncbi:hypothetical protein GGU11DRAFT_819104 [Lentinula aff. detonsa]|nr:hypothetical protein GGU11DRAFT_819104 [Lentinula aff. detonsa]
MYLEQTDPGSKSIVFSAWADSLANRGIRGDGPVKKFKANPEISVLLLHGERENASLNITCASRVFLLESVVHHGFEIQAIARIDRMGQTRPTEVYCYYAEDTVERNILDLAARQGLSPYTKVNSAGTLNVSPFANEKPTIESLAKKNSKAVKGDFISKIDDMLAVRLFPLMFEDLEYLLPPEDVYTHYCSYPKCRPAVQENAVAGPSRLRR